MEKERRYLCVYLRNKNKQLQFLEKIARWALRFTPLVGVDRERGVLLDLTGTTQLHADGSKLALKIKAALQERGIECSICIAPTIGAAWGCAQYANADLILNNASLRAALAELPVQALRIEASCVDALKQIGIYQIAQLLKLPRKGLGLRFGTQLLKRLDQALGYAQETFQPIQSANNLALRKLFEHPLINHESIKLCVLDLLEALFQTLARQHKRAATLQLEFITPNRLLYKREISLYSASKDFKHVSQIIEPILDQLQISQGVQEIRVDAQNLEPTLVQQHEFGAQQHVADLEQSKAQLIDRLGINLGTHNLKQVEFKPSHVPEQAFGYHSVYSKQSCAVSFALPENRPPYLLQRPEPFDAISLLPDRPPLRITWKGRSYKILQAFGPEKILPEWWLKRIAPEKDRDLGERQYFKIQDETGAWLWVFRTSSLRWFVHGIWV